VKGFGGPSQFGNGGDYPEGQTPPKSRYGGRNGEGFHLGALLENQPHKLAAFVIEVVDTWAGGLAVAVEDFDTLAVNPDTKGAKLANDLW
jgi:hypothetical protein